ncbi:MAG: hypothetical protein A2X86_21075 [Bdellovibrionales bacterium GWA2_49_15]|nr:MAG: hypothetical protein A2X86_21075 [Bdellovibrionales bacterium GWA2_49_15]HAZ14872.1 hypothetical protein [Bdellovibrionales bacterium]
MNLHASELSPYSFIAKKSLEDNIVTLSSGPYLRAGAHHFGGLWTRDFCFSIEGLLKLGHAPLVKNHLEKLILARRRSDNLVPRSLDSIPTVTRVLLENILRTSPKLHDPLKPEFKGEHGTLAIDSNLLVLRGVLLYFKATGDRFFQDVYGPELRGLLDFYRPFIKNGLIVQPKFSDWQDSVARNTATFLTNFLFWETSLELKRQFNFELSQQELDSLKALLWKTFYLQRAGLFRSLPKQEQLSLDGNLFALLRADFWRTTEERAHFYQRLKRSPLWKNFGLATVPNYPPGQKSWTTKMVGLVHYHDQMLWSWLQGLCLKVAKLFHDTAEVRQLEARLNTILMRDLAVQEIYTPATSLPFKKAFYRSENPFSWGAAFIVDAGLMK